MPLAPAQSPPTKVHNTLYTESLALKERLGNVRGRASTLHQLCILAQNQGEYTEARRLYEESLALKERLGDVSGPASTLGQLGLLAQQQGDDVMAMRYTCRALAIFEQLGAPYRIQAQQVLAGLRERLGEEVFAQLWREEFHDLPVPPRSAIAPQEALLQRLIAFIQAPNWTESQRLVETQPDLLSPEADALLEQLAGGQRDAEMHGIVEARRALLARCHEIGIAAAFAELRAQREQSAAESFTAQLNALCQEVLTVLRAGDENARQILAARLDALAVSDEPLATAREFLELLARLVTWRRGGGARSGPARRLSRRV